MNERAAVVRPATYQDVLDAPPHLVAELIRGALHLSPRPAVPHAYAGSSLTAQVFSSFGSDHDGPGGWWILAEPELHLAGDVLVPDLAGWRRERLPELPRAAAIELAPDWVCEILSPATRKLDLTAKRERYLRAGVAHLWHVDPEARTLEAFALRDGAWALAATLKDDDTVRVAPFDAVAFPLASLWPD